MHLDYIAVIIDSGQVAYLTGFFIKLCRKMFGSYQSAGILKFRFYQHLQFPMPQKSGNMLYIEQKKKSRRHEPSKLKKYPIRRKNIV